MSEPTSTEVPPMQAYKVPTSTVVDQNSIKLEINSTSEGNTKSNTLELMESAEVGSSRDEARSGIKFPGS